MLVTLASINIQTKTIPASHPQLVYLSATPHAPPLARLAILHGYGDHAGHYTMLMESLALGGIASCAINFRGHGPSGGKPCSILRWDEFLEDLWAFLSIDEFSGDGSPLFILGHSHGGLVIAIAGIRGLLDRCRGAVLSAPYLGLKMPVPIRKRMLAMVASRLHPTLAVKSGVVGPMLTRDPAMIAEGRADPYIRGIATPRWFTQTRRAQREATDHADRFKLPLLMLLPGQDTVADRATSLAFFDKCGSSDKTTIDYPDSLHELLREIDREKTFADIAHWISARSVR